VAKNKIWWGILLRVLSIISMLAPMGVWFIINRKEYFTTRTSSSMAIGVIIGLIFVVLVMAKSFKEMDKRASIMMYLLVGLALVWFMKPIINDMFWVLVCCIIGYTFYWPLSSAADRVLKHYATYREEKIRVEARKEAEAEVTGLALHM